MDSGGRLSPHLCPRKQIRASSSNLRDNRRSSSRSVRESTMRLRTSFVTLVGMILLSAFSTAQVLKIVVDDTIQAATQERIERAIDQAAADKDDAVLIELSTPGGVLDSTREIIQKILASPVPVIIYV